MGPSVQSGFCVDGVCCENACTGQCKFCASPEARGRCTNVSANTVDQRAARGETDPAKICVAQDPSTCGTDGRCNGQGACQRHRDGTVCAPPRCDATANTQTAASVCMTGTCQAPAARGCAPYRGCSGNACRNSCGADAQCSMGNVCTANSCGKKPNGAVCTNGPECMSNVCAQGRCCAGACNGTCRSCAIAGQEGACVNVPVGGADPTGMCRDDACSNGCDGNAGCRREPTGTTCGAASCNGNTQVTRTCNAGGACATNNNACAVGFSCMGGSCVANPKGNGEPCVSNAECSSNRCIDNVCCATACMGDCRQCQAGSGTCGNRSGSCGVGGTCMGGVCCNLGTTNCSGVCRNLQTEEGNCGSCGNVCASGRICVSGRCVCDAGTIECGGNCIDPNSNVEHCGRCSNSCAMGATCNSGTCGACPDRIPFDCDGVCKACCATCNDCQRCSNNGRSCIPDRDTLACGNGQVCCAGACCAQGKVCRDGCNDPLPICSPTACAAMGPCRECKSDGTCGIKAPNTSCDDGDACTTQDACNGNGTCSGNSVACNTPPNNQCFNSPGSCSGGNCSYTKKPVGTGCNDGNSCTVTDECNADGVCVGSAMVCNSPPNTQCFNSPGSCSDGACSYSRKPAGTSCDDGNSCTMGDACNPDGMCVGSGLSCNSPPNNQCFNTPGSCSGGSCSYMKKDPGTGCSDGNACTDGDRCNADGECAGNPITCNAPPNAQCFDVPGSCSGGNCSYNRKEPGTGCNDGNACTENDRCGGNGECAGSPVACNSPPNALCFNSPGTCGGGDCTYMKKPDGTTCGSMQECRDGLCTGVCADAACGVCKKCNPARTECINDDGATCEGGTCLGGICIGIVAP